MPKFYITPFADTGDKAAIPDADTGTGAVSYAKGFTSDYQKNLITDATARPIPRSQTNELYYDITANIQEYQIFGVPAFITTVDNGGVPYPYAVNARVRYDDGVNGPRVYESRIGTNVDLPSVATSWRVISGDAAGLPAGMFGDFGSTTAPAGFLVCDGTEVSRTTYFALFAAIGTTWGVGNGTTTFNLPDLQRRVRMGSGGVAGTPPFSPLATVGSYGGVESHAITTAEMPSHDHPGSFVPHGVVLSNGSGGDHALDPTIGGSVGVTVAAQGGGAPMWLVQPAAVVLSCIKY